MASLDQLQQALVGADQAGDTEGAKALAQEIRKMQAPAPELQAGLDGMQKTQLAKETQPKAAIPSDTKAIGSGLAEGAIGATVGVPGDLEHMANATNNWFDQKFPSLAGFNRAQRSLGNTNPLNAMARMAPSTQQISQFLGTDYQPQNTQEKYEKSSAAGAAGFFNPLGKAKGLVSALMGAGMGAIGEGGAQIAGDEARGDGVGRVAAQTPLLAALMFLKGRTPNAVKATQDTMREVGPQGLQDARDTADSAAKTLGLRNEDVLLTQGMDQKTPLSGITQALLQHPQGEMARRALDRSLPVGQDAIDEMVANTSKLPIDQTTANRVAAAGGKAVERPEEVRSQLAGEPYRKAGNDFMAPDQVAQMATDLRGVIVTHNLSASRSGAAVEASARRLDKLVEAYPNGVPVLAVDNLAKEASAMARAADKPEAVGADIARALGNRGAASEITAGTTAASPNLAAGKDRYARASEAMVDPMQQSAMTSSFPQEMTQSGKGDWSQMGAVLSQPEKYGPKDIRYVAGQLRRADPEAFPALAKQRFESAQLDSQRVEAGRESAGVLSDFPAAIAGPVGSKQRENFKATIEGVALSRGADQQGAQAAVHGAENLMDALTVISRERESMGQVSTEFGRNAGTNFLSQIMKSAGFNPGWTWGNALERRVAASTYKKVAEALTSPNGVRMLQEVAAWDPASERIKVLARSFLGENAQEQARIQ